MSTTPHQEPPLPIHPPAPSPQTSHDTHLPMSTVLVIDEGNGARQVIDRDPAPVRAVIVGVVDDVALSEA